MPCFYPVTGYYSRRENRDPITGQPNGKRSLVFDKAQGFADRPVSVACGVCQGCLLARAASWAVKATHESGLHAENSFLTLTYDQDNLPDPPLVSVFEVQLFLKRLRQHVKREAKKKLLKPSKVRYLACGEYGSKTYRPHYHLLIFGWRPSDGIEIRNSKYGAVFYSETLRKLWPQGLSEFGSVTPASAGYVARYTTKKIFERDEQGSEFLLSSRQPALGIPWLKLHYKEIYNNDQVSFAGKTYRPPETYDKWLERNDPDLWHKVRVERACQREKPELLLENDSFRLPAREKALIDRIRSLTREGI